MSIVDDIIEHHGVKGMHWGVRRRGVGTPTEVVVSHPGKRVKAKGGENQPAHEDAIKTATSKRVAKKSGTDSLSTRELQDLVNRMNLEQQYSSLSSKQSTLSQGKKVVDTTLAVGKTANSAIKFANSPAGKALRSAMA